MPTTIRHGHLAQLTLEFEAWEILRRLAPNKKTGGHLVSMLLRQEEQRRHDIRTCREQDAPAPGEPGT